MAELTLDVARKILDAALAKGIEKKLKPLVLTVLAGALVGAINWVLIVRARIPSFIATLGMSSILAAFVSAVSGNQQLIGMPQSFSDWTTFELFGIVLALFLAAVGASSA